MIIRPFAFVMFASVLGVVIASACALLNPSHAIDPLSAAGMILALGLGALIAITAARLLYAIALAAFAAALLLAPIAFWFANLLMDPFGARARRSERARIGRLYPPSSSHRSFHVQA